MFAKIAPKSLKNGATFLQKIVTKNFQKSGHTG